MGRPDRLLGHLRSTGHGHTLSEPSPGDGLKEDDDR